VKFRLTLSGFTWFIGFACDSFLPRVADFVFFAFLVGTACPPST